MELSFNGTFQSLADGKCSLLTFYSYTRSLSSESMGAIISDIFLSRKMEWMSDVLGVDNQIEKTIVILSLHALTKTM